MSQTISAPETVSHFASNVARAIADRDWKSALSRAGQHEKNVMNWCAHETAGRTRIPALARLEWGATRARTSGDDVALEIITAFMPWANERCSLSAQEPERTAYRRTSPVTRSTMARTATADEHGNAVRVRRANRNASRQRKPGTYATPTVESPDDRERDKPITCNIDYDRAAMPCHGWPCLECNSERSIVDRRTPDGLCGECRERQRSGLPEPASWPELQTATEHARQAIAAAENARRAARAAAERVSAEMIENACAYIWGHQAPAAALDRIEKLWRAADTTQRRVIAAWVNRNVPAEHIDARAAAKEANAETSAETAPAAPAAAQEGTDGKGADNGTADVRDTVADVGSKMRPAVKKAQPAPKAPTTRKAKARKTNPTVKAESTATATATARDTTPKCQQCGERNARPRRHQEQEHVLCRTCHEIFKECDAETAERAA
ncbi:hypothetical protein [Saccharopolyspora elongata]|uniref:Uncharacterized protein n=1 Tax=Saccharopolyspora elongata TaxID=2530387 RepID=A0A4R4XV07_9PSEU|nr:hypothetical protein [Saccharopolyspora elongata]TDD35498.1 hypothetical protein E1288_43140 [Saccharopolyspora elongata]